MIAQDEITKLVERAVAEPQQQPVLRGEKSGNRRPMVFFAALALFACANVYLSVFSKHYQPSIEHAVMEPGAENNGRTKSWSWWIARKFLEQKTAPDVVLFGSSQIGSALAAADAQYLFQVVDALTHRRAATLENELHTRLGQNLSVFSLASPGAMCSDALMASRALFQPKLKPKLVIIGVSPRDFIDNTMPYPAATEPYRFYSQYVSPGSLTWSSYTDPMSWLQFSIDSMPFKKLGTYLQSTLANSGSEDKLGTDKETSNTASPMAAILGGAAVPGKWGVPANIPPIWVDNTREYKTRFRDPRVPVYQCESRFFRQFMSDMQAKGIKVLVVGMPSLPINRSLLPDTFWSEFRSMLASQSSSHNAYFLDLTGSPDFAQRDYLDTVHLNATGGLKLFSRMAEYIHSTPAISDALAPDGR